MDKDTRNAIERATQRARKLLEEDFAAQFEGDFDVHRDGAAAAKAGRHLSARQAFLRERIVAAIEHKRAAGMSAAAAARDTLRDAAFTTLNRFVALKMLEARDLVQECITKGEQSAGYREFCGMAPGLQLLPASAGYRLYLESLFDELSTDVKVLFDRRDPSSALWPKRATFEQLLETLNARELAGVWVEDETIGWVYQFFNGPDERKKMREESRGPRNSRELAVRNQFFTPRYVVQFLTDNTLGRIWYEMRSTATLLAERCKYMVRKPGEAFAPRAKKDPRDLRVLDPACGSGHFLLYAFDLLLAIYEEAQADPGSPKSGATGRTLAEDYPSVEALKEAVPGLVLAHNLHGVDIDPRCAQIAQLALWMRAQRAYRDFGIGRAERAQIRRSNIVVAEPLVVDAQIAKEFVAKLGDVEVGRVFMALVESLSLAGELGLLLRVEQLLARSATREPNGDLFAPAEERIRAVLERFVREEATATNTRRRLFADDAAHGVALLGVAEKKFDAVLMNPPFGPPSVRAKKLFESTYPRSKFELYAAFIERAVEMVYPGGRIGALTTRSGLFVSSLETWREEILLGHASPVALADLGFGVLDGAMVETTAYCVEKGAKGNLSIVDIRTAEPSTKHEVLEERLGRQDALANVDPDAFRALPGKHFAYWLPSSLLRAFRDYAPLESQTRVVRRGAYTTDDFRFNRLHFEISIAPGECAKYRTLAKGGAFSRYYSDLFLVIRWSHAGAEAKAHLAAYRSRKGWGDDWTACLNGYAHYGRPGLTYSMRSLKGLSFRAMPSGSVFSLIGPAVLSSSDSPAELLELLCLMNGAPFGALADAQVSAAMYQVGVIQSTPAPVPDRELGGRLAVLARRAWSLMRSLDSTNETSHAFVLPLGLNEKLTRINRDCVEREVGAIQKQIDDAAFTLYDIGPEDRAAIEAGSNQLAASPTSDSDEAESSADADVVDDETTASGRSDAFASWLVGVAFGRFDPRLATGERQIPPEPEPFDPLPSRSPGMYPEGEEPADPPDVLVDDEGHAADLASRAAAVAERVQVAVPENLRAWLTKEFFPQHIRMYSKSRRKAPIYWQLATPSASYSVWLYIHAFSKDTLFRVQNDYVGPKLAHEERRLESLTSDLRDGATGAQRKTCAAQEALVDELRAFLEEVKRVAPLWKPSLDDGVLINFAPLWRLVPQNRSWQNELRSTWDALSEGRYDWAHLAMHLWPERVVPKCAKDRSLAIAHGLEDVFWESVPTTPKSARGRGAKDVAPGLDDCGGSGSPETYSTCGDEAPKERAKWVPRTVPARPLDDLVRERSSPSVKAALKSLLEAAPSALKTRATGRKQR